ncbi:MAG: hypothetical protein NTX50_15015 [Candidatus Sumerlaeota bacterium]|nr:hypothetical protein [Candidatus Sumerlaeota bacterium]
MRNPLSRPSTSRKSIAVVFLLAVVTGIVSSFSVYYGLLQTPPDAFFLWSADPGDNNGYFAKMRTGYRGEWLTTMLYTSEEHPPVFLFPFHVLLGHAARVYGGYLTWKNGYAPSALEAMPPVYNAARFALVVALALTVYWFSGMITRRPRQRMWATAFAMFAGGWSALPNTEASVMKSCILFPNFTASLILYLLACGAFLAAMKRDRTAHLFPGVRAMEGRRRSPAVICVWAALAGFGLAWIHPFDVPPLCAIAAAVFAWQWLALRRFPRMLFLAAFLFALLAGGPILYQMAIKWRIPIFETIEWQNALYWSFPGEWARMLDIYLIIGLAGLYFLWRRKRRRPEAMLLIAWVVVVLAMVNIPVRFQRRMIEGLPIALAFAALVAVDRGLFRFCARLRRPADGKIHASDRPRLRRMQTLARAAVFLLLVAGTCRVLYQTSVGTFRRASSYYYMDKPEVEAMRWLETNSDWQQVVWAEKFRGNAIPFLSGNRVFYGLDAETVDSRRKLEMTAEFFSWKMPRERFREICRKYNVAYIYFGPRERAYDGANQRDIGQFDPETLKPVYAYDGSPDFVFADYRNGMTLVQKLRARADPPSRYIVDHLSPETRRLLPAINPLDLRAEPFFVALMEDFNRLVRGPLLYSEERFTGISLPQTLQSLAAKNSAGEDLARVNRMLIEAAYPAEFYKIQMVRIYQVKM